MATNPILARTRTLRATSMVRAVAADLHALYAADSHYGVPFCRALTRVVDHAATAHGIAYVPLADGAYGIVAGGWAVQ